MQWVAAALVLAASVWAFTHTTSLARSLEMGPRRRRLVTARGLRAFALWECAVAVALITSGGGATFVIGVLGVAGMLMMSRWAILNGVL
jgi:hypothetical protein